MKPNCSCGASMIEVVPIGVGAGDRYWRCPICEGLTEQRLDELSARATKEDARKLAAEAQRLRWAIPQTGVSVSWNGLTDDELTAMESQPERIPEIVAEIRRLRNLLPADRRWPTRAGW